MRNRANVFLAAAFIICMIPAAALALSPYSEDFEGLNQSDTGALGAAGWVVFSDYNNADHGNGATIEALVFQEHLIGPGDVGETWIFEFDAKRGNLEGATTAAAFIKTLDPNNGYAQTNYFPIDMTTASTSWTGYAIAITITPDLDGQLLQTGFSSRATNYEGSGVFYDNLEFYNNGDVVPIEDKSWGDVKSLFR